MKRFLYIMFACACALFAFVSNAEAQAQAPDGTYVTISYTYRGTTYYLAVDNGAVTTITDGNSENCVWIQTEDNAFWSVTAKQYLSIIIGSSPSLTLQPTGKPFTYNSNQLYFQEGKRYYYITFSTNSKKFGGARTSNNANPPTNGAIIIDNSSYTPTYKFTSATPNKTSVTISELWKIRVLTNDKIEEIVDDNKIKLTNATIGDVINSVEIENNQLVITTTINKEGTYNLTIGKGAVRGLYEIDFDVFEASWTISPYDFISATPNKTSVTASELKEIRVSAIDKIGNIAKESDIILSNANIENITIDKVRNQLVISATPISDGNSQLTIKKGAVVGEDGVDFSQFTRSWTITPYDFISATPVKTSVTASELREIRVSAIDKIYSIVDEEAITLSNADIDDITIDEVKNQLVITTQAPYTIGDCQLTIPKGAVVGLDDIDFAPFTRSWTISNYKFTSSTPTQNTVTASELREIRVSAIDKIYSIVDEEAITLSNADIDDITIDEVKNQLVITTQAPYTIGDCQLTIPKGAVVGWGDMPFEGYTRSWQISLYTFTSVNPKAGKAGAFSVVTLTADVAINEVSTADIRLDGSANGFTCALSDDKKQLIITSNTRFEEGDHTLSIAKGAVVAEDDIAFADATYNWTIVTTPQFIDVTPATGTTYGFNTITLTASADIEGTLRFGYYYPDNNQKIKFTHSLDSEVKTSYVGSGVDVKRIDDRTLEVIIPDNLGEGTYRLEIQDDAIQTKDQGNFAAATYTWTVNAHQFGAVQPATLDVGERLEQITIPAADPTVAMSIPHAPDQIADWITLTNAGGAVIPTTAAIVNNELVITPVAALGNGAYTLNVKKGAVVGPHSVPFVETSKKWNVVVSVAITHVKGFYPALGAGGYQNVHTVERTIYYDNTTTSIPLTLAETNFFGYMRWYDYTTDRGTNITWTTPPSGSGGDFEEIVGTGTHLGWFGWNRSNTTGNPVDNGGTGGVLNNTENSNKTPTINISGWTGSHTIACDVSHYLDYTITRVNDDIVGITEPRLSYRQLFHFRPASEMADKFKALESDEYLEEYTYTAPTGTNVYLSTEFRYNGDNAENCYFYYDGGQIKRVTTATWSTGVTWQAPYGVVSSTTAGIKTYTLTSGTLRIAKFTVTYVDKTKYGPVEETGTNGSAKALMSYAEMNAKFDVLEYNNFSFGQKPNGSAQQYLTTPLPYDQSTYGFSHMASDAIKPNNQYSVPYYGEYAIVNRIGDDYWEESANHVDGGANVDQAAAQGFGIYVDGTTKPGVVASISTKVTICAERTMYCSVWLRNPRPSGQCGNSVYKPIFRCNVQGRTQLSNGEYTPWEDVGVYFVGEIPCASGWQQVNFPIESQETYSECRVQIYNFGTGGNGNDFWLDDLCIYADKLPMSSYQLQTEMCCSPDHDGTTFTAAVLRVDYGINTLHETGSSGYQYYQIYNKTTGKPFVLTSTSLSPYYDEHKDYRADGLTKEQYGSIEIKAASYTPSQAEIRNNPSELVGELLNTYHLDTKETKTAPLCGKCFVKKRQEEITSESQGEYYMYVVHIIPNIRSNRVEENYLQEHCQYTLRMTSEATDLLNPTLSCAVEIDLPSTQESLFRLMSEQIETTEFLTQSSNNCPNEQYTIEAFIRKDNDPYSDQGNVEATYLADWMYGHAFDEVYRMDYPHASDDAEDAAKDAADGRFADVYKCTRAQVTDAFLDLRRPDKGNDNYGAKTFGEIDPQLFTDYDTDQTKDYPSKSLHYETLKYLHEQGWLQLATSSVSFYLGANATARYWVFPIENSAKAADGTPLHDCPEPRWVQVNVKSSDYYINLAPGLVIGDQALQQQVDPRNSNTIPHVRVLARMVNNTIQIPIHQISSGNYEIQFAGDDGYIYLTNDDRISNPQSMKYTCSSSNNVITLMPAAGNTAQLQQGKEYTMCILMRNKAGEHRSANDDCAVGKVYVKLLILPDVVTWAPTTPDMSWHNDANWKVGDDSYYAPIAGSNVIIPANVPSPILSTIDVANGDKHPYPLDANFALTPTCGQIYFEPGAMMLNQHLLQHDKAFVDLVVPNQTWNTVAVPISGVVSGDMYIPHSGDMETGSIKENDPSDPEIGPFVVNGFTGARHSESAFPFWLSVYNKTVQVVNENPSKTGSTISTNTETFAPTNSLVEPIEVGSGYQLLGFGPNNYNYTANDLTIRLPKPDNMYSYYYTDGSLGQNVTINRGANSNKLIYSPDVPITLTNERTSKSFMFGNPTMAMIDLTKCLPDGATIYKMVNDSWGSGTKVSLEMDEAYRYLEPMRSVLVTLPTAGTTAEIDLQAEDLTTPEKIAEAKANNIAPRRNASGSTLQLMTIYADVYGTKARCVVASKDGMKDSYVVGEDALFISSGVEAEVNDATATSPVNMYTVSDNVPLMVDIREKIDTIPLGMLIHDYYRTEKITMTFNLSANWDKECYFCDAVTGERYRIMDGLVLEMDMPQNHETRYFIDGPDVIDPDNGGDIWSSTEDVKTSDMQVWAYSPSQGELVVASNDIIKEVTVYDVAGRVIAHQTLNLQYSSMTIATIPGVCIVETTLRDNTKHYTQTVVR